MSSLVPDTSFAQGASGPQQPYDTSPAGLGLSPAYLASSSASSTASAVSSGGGGGGGSTTGMVAAFAGSSAPADWVLCDGSTYDGTDPTYAALWGVIGTDYGGTGIASFKVPDLRGRVVVAKGTNADVSTLGNNDGQAVGNRRPKHRTTSSLAFNDASHSHAVQTSAGDGVSQNSGGASGTATIDDTAFDSGHLLKTDAKFTGATLTGSIGTNNANDALDTPSYIVLNYIIAL